MNIETPARRSRFARYYRAALTPTLITCFALSLVFSA